LQGWLRQIANQNPVGRPFVKERRRSGLPRVHTPGGYPDYNDLANPH
jgi:hypothetical protein